MNRRQAAQVDRWAEEDAAAAGTCGLCGERTPTFVDPDDAEALATFDLCGRCNVGFRELAAALAAAAERREERQELVDQVAGQLELVEDEADQEDTLEEELGALQLGQVLHAFATGEWDEVPTLVIADAVQLYADGFRKDELQVMRAILRNRA
jgi:hypothetical protein